MSSHPPPPPPLGPKPLLLTNKQISALYRTLSDLTLALKKLNVDWVVTGGSSLGCIRQEGVLFCDDDIDIAIISEESYAIVREKLSETIGKDYTYKVEAWEGGDKLRPRYSDVFIDIFCLRDYKNEEELKNVIGIKKNGQAQSSDYVNDILNKINTAVLNGNGSYPPLYPLYHFSSRKAIEMWPKEVYRTCELLPIRKDMRFGPVLGVGGPRCWKLLLERAFGSDCFEVYYESVRHSGSNGGMWEMSEKTELKDEHYIPIQPLLKKERVESSHNKESLFKWLEREEKIESCWLTLPEGKKRTVYMDGVFDLFHVGHLEAIKQARRLGDFLILGVTGDKDAEGYKRRPVICEEDRCCVLRELKDVGEVLCPCPLIVTEEFMKSKGIDLVVHGFKNYEDVEKQREFFEWPMEVGRFELIQYSNKASTSEILERIVSERILEMEVKGVDTNKKNPEWFGASVASVTNDSAELPRPFTAELEEVIMKHVEKAMVNSDKALEKIESEVVGFRNVLDRFMGSEISREGTFEFDTEKHDVVAAFLEAAKLEKDYDLARMHEREGEKERLYANFVENYKPFQETFDDFVRDVCCPQFEKVSGKDVECIYYQSFPCVRVVEVDDFSIGPHSDVVYGHHPCSVNFYVPLTDIFGTNELYMESERGRKDFRGIFEGGGGRYGVVKHFAGALCVHWTTENKTEATRVSLDVRLVDGADFEGMKCKNVYVKDGGFYHVAKKVSGEGGWVRQEEELHCPDARSGFPWTKKKKKTV